MKSYNRQKIKFTFKKGYIFIFILCFVSAFMLINLISAADTDQINIAIPRIEGVDFYRVSGDTQTKINILSSTKNLSFSETETLNLKVEIDDNQYFSGADEADREEVKKAFSLTGGLTFESEPVFEDGYWDLKIKKSENGNLIEENALKISLKEKQSFFFEFLNSDGISFFSEDGEEELGGTIKTVRETQSFEFMVKLDTTKINITNPENFEISAGYNTCNLEYISKDSGVYTYKAKIDKIIDSAHIEAAELINITLEEIQGISYYSDENCNNRIADNVSKVFARGSKFEFYILIDSKVPINTAAQNETYNEEKIEFHFSSNETKTEYLGNDISKGRKYKITLTDVKISASTSVVGLYKIWFQPKALGITYAERSTRDSNGYLQTKGAQIDKENQKVYRSVGIKSTYEFEAQLDYKIFSEDDQIEFLTDKTAMDTFYQITKRRSTEPIIYEITLSDIEADGEIRMNYLTAGFTPYNGITYYQVNEAGNLEKIENNQYFSVKETQNFIFYMGFDTSKTVVGDNLLTINVNAGGNSTKTSLATKYGTEKEKVFMVTIVGVTESYILEVPDLLTFDLNNNFENLTFWNARAYTEVPDTPITGAALKKTVIKGSEYTCVARLLKSEVWTETNANDGTGTMRSLRFEFGEGNPTKVEKYYDRDNYVYYNVTGTINNSGKVALYDAYTVEFEETGAELGFTYNNRGQSKIKGHGDCTFDITEKTTGASTNPSPEFFINGESDNEKLTVSESTYTIKNISEDTVITPVTREISYLPSGQGYTITPKAGTPISNGDGSATIKVAKNLNLQFDIKLDNSVVKLTQNQINAMQFRCGNNTVTINSWPTSTTGWITFTVTVNCIEDGTLSVGKAILFPDIYNVNFYECKDSGTSYSLGEQIQSGSQKGFMPGDMYMFFVEIDSSVAVPDSPPEDLFSMAGNTMTYKGTIKPSNAGDNKKYFCYKIENIASDSSLVSKYLFTVDLPVLNSIYYYTDRDANSEFSGQMLDNKFTVYKDQNPKYKFYVHFDGVGARGTISSADTSKLEIKTEEPDKADYTIVTVDSITSASSITITDWDVGKVSVEMPSVEKCLKTLTYSYNSEEFKDGDGWTIDMTYGSELKLRFSFKADAEGYTNLYKTLYSQIKVKVYKTDDSASADASKVLLKTLSIRNLDQDANEFIVPNIEYETESYKPYCDVYLEIEGIKEDIYDVNIVSGDNSFLDEFVSISSIIKIKKIENETGKPVDDKEVEVPFSIFRNGYLMKSIRYGEELRFKCDFTNGANDEGIKYNLSELTLTIDPYEGDSGELDADENKIYSAVIKTNSEISLSGITGNKYEINIPKTPSVTVKYVINSEFFPSDDLILTAEDNKILIAHGQKILMRISSNDATKRYIKKVTAKNTMYGSDPETLYDALADQNEVEVSIEEVIGHTDLSIEVSVLEYEIFISLRETDENNNETYLYPDVDKLYIYENNTGTSLNVATSDDGEEEKANYVRYTMEVGKDFDFKISLDYKYNKSNIAVSYKSLSSGEFGSSSMIHPEKEVYSLKIDQSYRIFIDNVKINVYDVEFPQPSEEINFHRINVTSDGKEETYPLPMNGVQKFEHGETLLFCSKINAGYELAGDSVKANDEPLRLKNGRYELANISSDIKITVDTLDKIEYTITFPTTINGVGFIDTYGISLTSSKKKFGETMSFKIMLDSQYSQSLNNVRVYAVPADTDWENSGYNPAADSTAILLYMDAASNYNLTSVSRDSVIVVTGVEKNKYFIDLPLSEEGISFYVPVKNRFDEIEQIEVTEENEKELSVCVQGENFMFSVVAKAGYDVSQMLLTATVTGATLENTVEKLATGYIIQEVNYDYTVKVSNIQEKYHTVIISGDNVECRINPSSAETIKGGSVQYGIGEFKFYVTPSEGYVFDDAGLIALAQPLDRAKIEVPKLLEDGSLDGPVVVKEVTGDINLMLSGVHAQTFNVTLPVGTEGISFMYVGEESSDITADSFELGSTNIVDIGKSFKFYIKPDAGYDISNISVSTGPGEYIYPLAGIYTISNVRKDIDVQVENVDYSKYNVKIRGDNMTFYEPNGLFPQSDFTVPYMGSTEFRIVANTGYEVDMNDIYFSVGGKNVVIDSGNQSTVCIDRTDKENVFKLWNVTSDTSINVSGAKKQIYILSFPTDIKGAILKTPQGEDIKSEERVEYLSNFDFEVIPDIGYNVDSVNITLYPPENGIVKPMNGGYSIQSITGNITVSVSDVKPNEHTVYYKGVGADFYSTEGFVIQSASAFFGESNVFSIKATQGYDLLRGYDISITNTSGAKATIHFPAITDEDASSAQTSAKLPDGSEISESARFTYTVSNIQGDLVVTIENVGKTEHEINFPTSVVGIKFKNEENQTITSANVLHGADFVFRIVAEEGYDISNIVVSANFQTIDFTDGKYTLENITQDISIDVSGVVSTRVYINLKYVPGVNYMDTNDLPLSTLEKIPANHGDSYSFKVSLDDAYSKSKDKMKVSINSENSVLSFERGIYTVSNIIEDIEITVSDVETNTYNVNLTETTGVRYKDQFGTGEIKGTQVVKYGEDFRFIVDSAEGYDLSDIEVSVKGDSGQRVALTPVDNVYTVPYVTMDYTVVVEKAKKEVYTVEIRLPEGVTLVDSQGRDMETRQSVDHGADLTFRLSIATAYDKSVPVVTVKGRTGEVAPENNLYTIRSITGDTIVEVGNITKNTYKVKFQATEGVVYRTEKNKDFSGYLEVEYGGTLNFKIVMKDEYDASQIMVLLDGDKVLAENGGVYQIISISADCEVSVKYSEKNVEEYVIEMIDALPSSITTRQQADQVVTVSRAFNSLPEERQALVTNLSKLKILQTQAADVHHESNDVEVSGGLDWNIKVVVTPLDGDAESVGRIKAAMQRKTMISHYEISLVDTLSGAKYEPEDNTTVSVVVPCEIPKGYMNPVIVHEKESKSIEYLDVLINNGYAKFDTTSFSIFGLAAKRIPNYVEETNEITVSLGGLTDDEEEVKKSLAQNLSSLLEEDPQVNLTEGNISDKKSGAIIDDTDGNFLNKILNWIVTHELLVTMIMILLFSIWIFIILGREKKKNS